MTQFNSGTSPTNLPEIRPSTDLYTVLLIIATALLAIGTVLVVVRSYQFFDGILPPSGG